jgi:hypothetical protein
MIAILLATVLSNPVPEVTARYCAKEVGIPYASDNFTEEEWKRFTICVKNHLHQQQV